MCQRRWAVHRGVLRVEPLDRLAAGEQVEQAEQVVDQAT